MGARCCDLRRDIRRGSVASGFYYLDHDVRGLDPGEIRERILKRGGLVEGEPGHGQIDYHHHKHGRYTAAFVARTRQREVGGRAWSRQAPGAIVRGWALLTLI